MATIRRSLSARLNGDGKAEVMLRLSVGRGVQLRLRSGVYVNPSRMDDGSRDRRNVGRFIMPRANQREARELRAAERELIGVEQFLLELCEETPRELLSAGFITERYNRFRWPEVYGDGRGDVRHATVYDLFRLFLEKHSYSERRVKNYEVLMRALQRFEAYRTARGGREWSVDVDTFSVDDVNEFEMFLRSEPEVALRYPEIYEGGRRPLRKGNNTIVGMFKCLRAFFNWCNAQELTGNRPFAKYSGVTSQVYGTPYYISMGERDLIADADLSCNRELEVQRDIFIFQCYVGCRVSDLMRLTPSNIIGGGVEYIASKTRGDRPEVIRVPLHRRAAEIVERYRGVDRRGRLFPFISPQRYNDAIKRVFAACGVTRVVTVLNPTTGCEEQRPINEVASSHIARRTFIGNLYKRVKDPNLVGKLSGHTEGSKAFARYRDIDEEMMRETIGLLGD